MFIFDIKTAVAKYNVRTAAHPSETPERLQARVVAFILEYGHSPKFASELCQGELPDLLSNQSRRWIDVDIPELKKIRQAIKQAGNYCLYSYKKNERALADLRVVLGERPEVTLKWIDLPWSLMATKLVARQTWNVAVIDKKIQINEWSGNIYDF